ncbi:hypothetical protein CH063_14130 [Colletotrichum higginsianum]|uniref:Cx9C motif-containing protein 4, mitochondrial n=1 Tax=Colletotrichum higginsianum (strain IMI 349063) TaxID=759273 RepID=H1VXA9_COLHI|nr:hypothetical protein CH063_14130 [Colletotrichum higginsianum]
MPVANVFIRYGSIAKPPTPVDCLTRNSYKEDRCQSAIMALYECCEAFYRFKGSQATTVSCPKPDLLQLKLNRLREELQVAKK